MAEMPTIDGDDELIRSALEHADVPPLLAALASATGDSTLLRDELRPLPDALLDPDAGVPLHRQAEGRALALEVLCELRDGKRQFAPPPDEEQLSEVVRFVVGNAQMDDYHPLFREELALAGEDPRAPQWHLQDVAAASSLDAIVIGAGMSGLLAAHRLQQAGVPVTVLEKNHDVGGTWLENTYPGCRVDVANHFYSYSCAQRDDWPQHFSSQDVLLDYFQQCATDWEVRDLIRFESEVCAAQWDDEAQRWRVTVATEHGTEELSAAILVSAVGQLNRPQLPDIAGIDRFVGDAFHSARWDHSVDLTGKRVAVIGTGASAMQLIPAIAEATRELLVFQRTPAWLIPTPEYYEDVPDEVRWLFRNVPGYSHWYRFWIFWRTCEGILPLVAVDPAWEPKDEAVSMGNEMVRQLFVAYLQEQFADRPELLEAVTPHYPPAAKRVIRDDGTWARTLKRDDVRLLTERIAEITETGVRTDDGVLHEVDVIVWATGFSAAQFLAPMQIIGREGLELREMWHGDDARAHLGMTVPGFPNLFCLYGPNTNIVINGSIIFFSECEVRYLLDAVRLLAAGGHRSIEVREEVHEAFNEEIDEANRSMAWGAATVNSWYRNSKGRSAQNWPFSLLEFWRRTQQVDVPSHVLR